jgi:hypothetical protein
VRPPDATARRLARLHRLSLERLDPPRRPRWPWLLALLAFLLGYGVCALYAHSRVVAPHLLELTR